MFDSSLNTTMTTELEREFNYTARKCYVLSQNLLRYNKMMRKTIVCKFCWKMVRKERDIVRFLIFIELAYLIKMFRMWRDGCLRITMLGSDRISWVSVLKNCSFWSLFSYIWVLARWMWGSCIWKVSSASKKYENFNMLLILNSADPCKYCQTILSFISLSLWTIYMARTLVTNERRLKYLRKDLLLFRF